MSVLRLGSLVEGLVLVFWDVSICRSLLSKAVGGLGCAPKLNPTQRGVLLRRPDAHASFVCEIE
jgi:hypothetical protein